MLNEELYRRLHSQRFTMTQGEPVALVIDSPGGTAKGAYQFARLLDHWCGGFTAVVPEYAKSAATLLVLGARRLIMSRFAELGPLDVQLLDPEREVERSGLDEVHSLERLHASAMKAVDSTMFILMRRMTGKRTDTVLPMALEFVSGLLKPLYEKIDTVHYTMMSRLVKEAEEYAKRLLRSRGMDPEDAAKVAGRLVEDYPSHAFVIDFEEAVSLRLQPELPSTEVQPILDDIVKHAPTTSSVVGRVLAVDMDEEECQ